MLRTNVDALASNDLHRPADDLRRPAAARLLEGHLVQLGRSGLFVDRRLAPGLLRLRSRRLYRPLGYVRLADYLGERLGMSLRRCQTILRLERALAGRPHLLRALLDGELSLSKVETVARTATGATEDLWLERARSLTVVGLREAVARAVDTGERDGEAAHPTDAARARESPMEGTPMEDDEPGRLVTFRAPARVLAVWHWALDLIRRVAGRQEPAWRCAEYLAAEFLSGVPDLSREAPADGSTESAPAPACGSGGCDPAPAFGATEFAAASADSAIVCSAVGPGGSVPASPGSAIAGSDVGPDRPRLAFTRASDATALDWAGTSAWRAASSAVRGALVSIGSAADPGGILVNDEGASGDDDEVDAWALDARLRRLVRLRQSLAWRQGRLLAALASLGLHRELGFATLDDFVTERLAMSPRRARYLVSLDRRLRRLPLVEDAYRRGLVSWCQARLLVRVVEPSTQTRWIRYAREVTVRRLEDAIVACEIAAATPAHVGASVTGAPADAGVPAAATPAHIGAPPLPPVEPSPNQAIPRQAIAGPTTPSPAADISRLHTSAPGAPAPDSGAGPLHTSAPPECPAPPGPQSLRRIVFWAPLDVAALWDGALRACRAAAGRHLEDWECLLHLVQALRDTWENPDDPHWKRRYRIFERDGWRCMAPGCTSRSNLNEHHVVFRSRNGGDDDGNLVTLCVGHHQQGVHEGRIGCSGRAPGALWWDLGLRPDGPPLVRYFGERIMRQGSYVEKGARARASGTAGGAATERTG